MAWTEDKSWQDISSSPRIDGLRIRLLIPYDRDRFTEAECTDEGCWSAKDGCYRFDGEDGPNDIQPTHWKPLN